MTTIEGVWDAATETPTLADVRANGAPVHPPPARGRRELHLEGEPRIKLFGRELAAYVAAVQSFLVMALSFSWLSAFPTYGF